MVWRGRGGEEEEKTWLDYILHFIVRHKWKESYTNIELSEEIKNSKKIIYLRNYSSSCLKKSKAEI